MLSAVGCAVGWLELGEDGRHVRLFKPCRLMQKGLREPEGVDWRVV
jgi:hypothetical protein